MKEYNNEETRVLTEKDLLILLYLYRKLSDRKKKETYIVVEDLEVIDRIKNLSIFQNKLAEIEKCSNEYRIYLTIQGVKFIKELSDLEWKSISFLLDFVRSGLYFLLGLVTSYIHLILQENNFKSPFSIVLFVVIFLLLMTLAINLWFKWSLYKISDFDSILLKFNKKLDNIKDDKDFEKLL